ncbi:M24 family metallopeptidase [Fibrella sp. HMF5335]|uniref:M24 family metallopeptidase n=1 Tax=Fibrella rubiginis TaxID=2817060 RepID=A0A939K4I3_9BACT|nr:M24 family metallopeptidase [Fibrella rubiginis]MBO0938454.1 M24 family metallopeptidase [Fibrella rubiginis]
MRLIALLFFAAQFAVAQPTTILAERARAQFVDEVLEDRFTNLLPQLMRREGIDMWVIISREYNEDPVLKTMLPSTWLSARRRTIMVFFDRGSTEGVERLAIARYDVGNLLKGAWDIDVRPNQWDALMTIIQDRKPKKIGLNRSANYAHADGLTATEQAEFLQKLPQDYQKRIVSAEKLAVGWLESRTEKEMAVYPMICRLSHQIIQEGLSEAVIQPGITTTDDVVWWFRQRITDLGLDTWFHPTVDVQRADRGDGPANDFNHLRTFSKRPDKEIIQPGDLLHVDFGITYLRLNTDQQQHAYVLRPGEATVPESIRKAFLQGNRLQDILTEQFVAGKSGNQLLSAALVQAEKEGIRGTIYSHPIGVHGHAAGPTIGLWDQQKGVPGPGDYPLKANTAYSIELNAAVEIHEWKKLVRIMLEEDGFFDGQAFRYIDGRQTEIYTIPRTLGYVK